MKIILASHMGMCFGVRDAIAEAHNVHDPRHTTIYGELVHNRQVVNELASRGFSLAAETNRGQIPLTPQVLITAHGISDKERRRLTNAGKKLIDTTCPLVHRVHQAARKLEQDGYWVIVIGKPHHVEVLGITGDLKNFTVVESVADVKRFDAPRLGIVCQSTTAPAQAEEICQAIESSNQGKEIRFVNTICHPTRARQEAAIELLDAVDALVVVGGRNSNNTRQLVNLAQQHGVPALHVEGAQDLDPAWLKNREVVGLTAGTSTPDATIQAVHEALLLMPSPQDCVVKEKKEVVVSNVAPSVASRVHSDDSWLNYFRANLDNLMSVPWDSACRLTDAERAAISKSIATFQLGESAEGKYFLKAARRYAEQTGDVLYVEALKLFIAEENRHARDLGRFMQQQNIPLLQRQWTDSAFRRLRKLANLEICVLVLLTAEIVAKIYYKALRDATGSPVLKQICRQILRDETPHVHFQTSILAKIRCHHPRWRLALLREMHRVFFAGTLVVVWGEHGKVLRAGGYTFHRFWGECMHEFDRVFEKVGQRATGGLKTVLPQQA